MPAHIEGVGEEVWQLLSLLGAGLVVLTLAAWYFETRLGCRRSQNVHPLSVDTITAFLRGRNSRSASSSARSSGNWRDVDCAICISPPQYAVMTNCGHIFCGSCITSYWRHQNRPSALPCPCCRQPINLLLFDPAQRGLHNNRSVVQSVQEFNRFCSGNRSISEIINDTPVLLQNFFHSLFHIRTLRLLNFVRILAILVCLFVSVMYTLLPFDLIPEAVFGVFGFFDDVFVFLACLIAIGIIYRGAFS